MSDTPDLDKLTTEVHRRVSELDEAIRAAHDAGLRVELHIDHFPIPLPFGHEADGAYGVDATVWKRL